MAKYKKDDRVVLVDTVWDALREGKVGGVNTNLLAMKQSAERVNDPDYDQTKAEELARANRSGQVVATMSGTVTVKHDSGWTMTWPENSVVEESVFHQTTVHEWIPLVKTQDVTGTFDKAGGELIDGGVTRERRTAVLGATDEDFTTRRKRRRRARTAKDAYSDHIKHGTTWVVALSTLGRDKIACMKGIRWTRQAILATFAERWPIRKDSRGMSHYDERFLEAGRRVGVITERGRQDGLKECKSWYEELARTAAIAAGGSKDSMVPANPKTWMAQRLTLREALAGLSGFWRGCGGVPAWRSGDTFDKGSAYAYDLYRGTIIQLKPLGGHDFEYRVLGVKDCVEQDGLDISEIMDAATYAEARKAEGGSDPFRR